MCECVCVRERVTDSELFRLRSRGSKRESFLQNNFDYICTVCVDVCMYVCACERVTLPESFRLCLRGTCVCARVFVCVGESDFPESFWLRSHGMCVCVRVCVCVREGGSFRIISMNVIVCRFKWEMVTCSEYSQLGSQGTCVFVREWLKKMHLDYHRTVRVCVCACFCVWERVCICAYLRAREWLIQIHLDYDRTVRVRIWKRESDSFRFISIMIAQYVCVYLRIFVCEREWVAHSE